MIKYICKTIIVIIILFITGCASAQRKPDYQPRILDHPDATYENDVLPFIIEQLNHIDPIEKALLKQRFTNLSIAQNGYVKKQKNALSANCVVIGDTIEKAV